MCAVLEAEVGIKHCCLIQCSDFTTHHTLCLDAARPSLTESTQKLKELKIMSQVRRTSRVIDILSTRPAAHLPKSSRQHWPFSKVISQPTAQPDPQLPLLNPVTWRDTETSGQRAIWSFSANKLLQPLFFFLLAANKL